MDDKYCTHTSGKPLFFPEGEVITLTWGRWEDYDIVGHFKMLQGWWSTDLVRSYMVAVPGDIFDGQEFAEWLVARGIAEEVISQELHLPFARKDW